MAREVPVLASVIGELGVDKSKVEEVSNGPAGACRQKSSEFASVNMSSFLLPSHALLLAFSVRVQSCGRHLMCGDAPVAHAAAAFGCCSRATPCLSLSRKFDCRFPAVYIRNALHASQPRAAGFSGVRLHGVRRESQRYAFFFIGVVVDRSWSVLECRMARVGHGHCGAGGLSRSDRKKGAPTGCRKPPPLRRGSRMGWQDLAAEARTGRTSPPVRVGGLRCRHRSSATEAGYVKPAVIRQADNPRGAVDGSGPPVDGWPR
ncbi:hypothetical protein NL676_031305 [Syzygium grande]|nr:hypothetical protein NL676_031305 [Syzygium grande]